MLIELDEKELEIIGEALKSHIAIVQSDGRMKTLALVMGMPEGVSDDMKKTIENQVRIETDKKELQVKSDCFHIQRKVREILDRVEEFKS